MFKQLKEDLDSIMERDPAARSRLEVYLLYSGFKAVRSYRKANWFYRHNMKFIDVMIGSGANVLGPFRVGDGARVASGAVVLDEVPDNATAVGVPARIVRINGIKTCNLDQIHVSDPVAQELCRLSVEHTKLKLEVEDLKKQLAAATQQKLLPAPTEEKTGDTKEE